MDPKSFKAKLHFKHIEELPVKITDWIGSTSSIVAHTVFFVGIFVLRHFGFMLGDILLILTTVVSLEAIYLAIFIQMTVNRNTHSLQEVEEDIDDIAEDVDEMEKDIDAIQEDIDEIQEDEEEDEKMDTHTKQALEKIEGVLQKLIVDIDNLKNQQK